MGELFNIRKDQSRIDQDYFSAFWHNIAKQRTDTLVAQFTTWCQNDFAEEATFQDSWDQTQRILYNLQPFLESKNIDQVSCLILTSLLQNLNKDKETNLMLARKWLHSIKTPLNLREKICRFLIYQDETLKISQKFADSEVEAVKTVIKTSWLANNADLLLLQNVKGEVLKYTEHGENLLIWKLICEEYCCYDSPYNFSTPQDKFHFFYNIPKTSHTRTLSMAQKGVTLLTGLAPEYWENWISEHQPNTSLLVGLNTSTGINALPYINLDTKIGEQELEALLLKYIHNQWHTVIAVENLETRVRNSCLAKIGQESFTKVVYAEGIEPGKNIPEPIEGHEFYLNSFQTH